MSKVYSKISGFVGFNGQSVWLGEGDAYDADDPIVKARPDDFTSRPSGAAVVAEERATRRRTTRE
jgi:hypothetical protein